MDEGSQNQHNGNNPALPVGTILKDRFVLTELLATGGTSYVYRARDLLTVEMEDTRVNDLVVKVTKHYEGKRLSSDLLSFNEALITRKLTHPNIIRVYDFDTDRDYSFMTMEYLVGESLSTRLSRRYGNKLPYKLAMNVLTPAARAIEHANKHGVIHSDIKPGNILICADNTVKVIDFGTARNRKRDTDEDDYSNATDFTGYTPAYASPQVLLGNTATTSDDVYSLAFTIYETLSGHRPYNTTKDNIRNVQKLSRIKGINIFQWMILKKALSFDENSRYRSVHKFIKRFTWTRYAWNGTLLATIVVAAIVFGSNNIVDYYNTTISTDHKTQKQFDNVALVIEKIRNKNPLDRYKSLNELDTLPDIYKQAAYNMLAQDIIPPVSKYVHSKLYNQSELPDFNKTIKIVNAALLHYPDSAELVKTKQLIIDERSEHQAALNLQYQDQWANTSFTSKDAYALLETILQLKKLGQEPPQLNERINNRFIDELNIAIKQYNFIRIDQLARFQKALPTIRPNLTAKLIHTFQSANVLTQYTQTDPAMKPTYPTLAADVFWSPFFDSFNKSIKGAWKDKKLNQLKFHLDSVSNKIPDSYPPLVAAREKLAELLRSKARYYKRKGILKRKIKQLNNAAAELTGTLKKKM